MPSGHPLTQKQQKFILNKENQAKMFPSVIAQKLGVSRAAVRSLIKKES
jgi:biotin operon repressor